MGWRDIPIDDLELSVRSCNALKGAGYATLGALDDLFKLHKSVILKMLPNFGAKSYREVAEVLHTMGEKNSIEDIVFDWARNNMRLVAAIVDGRAVVVPTMKALERGGLW